MSFYLDSAFLQAVKKIEIEDVSLKKVKELRKICCKSGISVGDVAKYSHCLAVFLDVIKTVYELKTGESCKVEDAQQGGSGGDGGEGGESAAVEGDGEGGEEGEEAVDPLAKEVVEVYRCNPRLMKKLPPKYFLSIPVAGVIVPLGETAAELLN